MFLDGQLRALAEARRAIALRGELSRRFARLEITLARASAQRRLADLAMGVGVAKWLMARLSGR